MENVDISGGVKNIIRFGLTGLILLSAAIGYGVYNHYHGEKNIQIDNAKVTGTMVSVRALVNGKVQELSFTDGDEVQAGDIIAKIEVSVTPEEIQQLEEAVALAKDNYENLKLGQTVKVPIKKIRTVSPPVIPQNQNGGSGSATLDSLAERAKRMEELFEMGAVSAVQRDAAKQKYLDALAEGIESEVPASSAGATTIEEIEYVDQWQPTPPAVMATAESAIKQAELALNVAKQTAQKTEITAPVSGVIYYSVENENDLEAGGIVAKVGDSKELWLEAEVTEDIFNKITLGKKVNYNLDNKNLSGTVIEKISPTEPTDETENDSTENAEPFNDKFILRFSIPADTDIKPNTATSIKIVL